MIEIERRAEEEVRLIFSPFCTGEEVAVIDFLPRKEFKDVYIAQEEGYEGTWTIVRIIGDKVVINYVEALVNGLNELEAREVEAELLEAAAAL